MLDTSVAIGVRDDDLTVRSKVSALDAEIVLSIITRVELEGGAWKDPPQAPLRELRLDALLRTFDVLPFEDDDAQAYRRIVQAAGYSRRKILDRMIAAQALVAGATLVTLNPDDFKDVPGLKMLAW